MGRVQDQEYTYLNDREIAGTAIGTSPAGVAAYSDLQRAVYEDQPQDTAEALGAAAAADTKAEAASASADAASASAADAGTRADNAQTRADAAYDLAETKVTKDEGPTFQAMTGTATRTAMPVYVAPTAAVAYDATQLQALMDSVQAEQRRLKAVIDDLLANGALTG